MKKFYAILAAATVVLSASAADLNVRGKSLRGNLTAKTSKTEMSSMKKTKHELSGKSTRVMSARKAADVSSLEGTWEFQLGDYYFQTSTNTTLYVNFEATVDGNTVAFEDPEGDYLPFVGTYNSSTGNITFQRGYLGSTGQYYVYQEPFVYNWDTNDLDFQNISARFDSQSGSLIFSADNGIAWGAYTSQTASSPAGYFDIFDLEGAIQTEGGGSGSGEDEGDWTDVGMATFMDGWVLPLFGMDQTQASNQYEVLLQQNATNPTVYRLVNPYQSGPAAMYNENKTGGYITFDITDPDHVAFLKSEAGFAYSGAGISKFYCYNYLGCLMEIFEMNAADVVEVMEDEMPVTTFKDGVIYLGTYDDPQYGLTYDANFGYQADPTGGYTWQDKDGNDVNMTAKIIFPKTEPSLSINEVKSNAYPNGDVNFQVDVVAVNLELDDVTVYYQGPNDADYVAVEPVHGMFEFTLTDLEFDTDYQVKVYAESGDLKTDVKTVNFHTYAQGPGAVSAEVVSVSVDNITNTSADVYVSYGFQNVPDDAVCYVILTDAETRTDVKTEIEDPLTYGATVEIALTDLTPGTEYQYMIVAQIESASGDIIARSNPQYDTFTTLAEAPTPVLTISNVATDNVLADSAQLIITFTSENIPADATLSAIATEYNTRENTEAVVENDATTAIINLSNLEEKTEYTYMVVMQATAADGSILTRSNAMEITVATTGVDGISISNNANVRYFNLQGVEISNPEKGQMYIKIENNKATKVVK